MKEKQLKEIFLFKHLDAEEIKELLQISSFTEYKKDSIVFMQGDKPEYLHILIKGIARVYKTDINGNEVIIHRFKPVSLIAEMANLKNIPYPANCRMESNGIILKINFEKFKSFLKDSNICSHLILSLTEKLSSFQKMINNNMLLDTETKIAKFIYENSQVFENEKQHVIASLLNIRPETLSRKLKKFKELGIIKATSSKMKVVNREKILEYYFWD